MIDRKLIVPAEIEVCATCSYWDGIRSVDADVHVVVVRECCEGKCLVREVLTSPLRTVHEDPDCIWDDVSVEEPPAEDDQAKKTGT